MSKRKNECNICKLDIGGEHKCQECEELVHLTCGKGVGEERYSHLGECNACQIIKEGNVSSGIQEVEPIKKESDEDDEDREENFTPIEIPERLWKMFPQNGAYLVEIMKFAGYSDTDGVFELRKKEKRKEMFQFAIDMIEQVSDKRKMFGLFEKIPEKVRILPGLEYIFCTFLNECEKLSKTTAALSDHKTEPIKTKGKRKRKTSVQQLPITKKTNDVTETIEMVELRLNKWMVKNGYEGSYSIKDVEGVKFFNCLNCQRKLKLNKHTEGQSILSNVHRHFKKKECVKQKVKDTTKDHLKEEQN